MRFSCKSALVLLLSAVAFGQVPQGLTVSEDVRSSPEFKVLLYWQPVVGATSYNIYQGANPALTAKTCPTLKLDDTTEQPFYADDPNPGWYLESVLTGPWRNRVWCYAVTSIVNGVESAQTAPVSIAIGNAGYVFWSVRGKGTYNVADPCAGGAKLPVPSTNLADYNIQLYYQDPSGAHHNFQTLNVFEGTPLKLGVIWHAPAVATDGTIIPWSETGSYGFILTGKYIKKAVEATWAPRNNRTGNYYTQIDTSSLSDAGQPDDGAQCAFSPFFTDLWENVTQ